MRVRGGSGEGDGCLTKGGRGIQSGYGEKRENEV